MKPLGEIPPDEYYRELDSSTEQMIEMVDQGPSDHSVAIRVFLAALGGDGQFENDPHKLTQWIVADPKRHLLASTLITSSKIGEKILTYYPDDKVKLPFESIKGWVKLVSKPNTWGNGVNITRRMIARFLGIISPHYTIRDLETAIAYSYNNMYGVAHMIGASYTGNFQDVIDVSPQSASALQDEIHVWLKKAALFARKKKK